MNINNKMNNEESIVIDETKNEINDINTQKDNNEKQINKETTNSPNVTTNNFLKYSGISTLYSSSLSLINLIKEKQWKKVFTNKLVLNTIALLIIMSCLIAGLVIGIPMAKEALVTHLVDKSQLIGLSYNFAILFSIASSMFFINDSINITKRTKWSDNWIKSSIYIFFGIIMLLFALAFWIAPEAIIYLI